MTAEERYINNEKLAYAVLHKTLPAYMGDEDYSQIAKLGLWKACLTFDDKKGSAFSTYAYTVVRNELFAHGKKELREKKIGEVISMDAPISEELNEMTLHDVIADSSNLDVYEELEKNDAFCMLDERERLIINLRLQGKTYVEIANDFGLSRQRIHVIATDALRRMVLCNEMGRNLSKREYRKIQKESKKREA